MADTTVLSLQTITTFSTVQIDRTKYRLLPKEALSLFDCIKLEDDMKRTGELLLLKAPSKSEKTELSQMLKKVCTTILDAPSHVQQKLKDPQRLLILQAFMALPRIRPTTEAAGARAESRKSQGKSSRGSRGSTAETRTTGLGGSRGDLSSPVS